MDFDNKRKVYNIIGQIAGAVSAICGFVLLCFDAGHGASYSFYGGDAYTGIQNAAAQTANNVRYLAEITKFGFSILLIALGVAIFCYFGCKLAKNAERQLKSGSPNPNEKNVDVESTSVVNEKQDIIVNEKQDINNEQENKRVDNVEEIKRDTNIDKDGDVEAKKGIIIGLLIVGFAVFVLVWGIFTQ